MYIVVVGAGRIGSSLAKWLVAAGHEIAVVEEDDGRCSALDEALGNVSVAGDCVDATVLERAGTNRADILIATAGRDDVNLAVCQLAKNHFDVPRTVSVVNVREHTELFEVLEVDVVVDATDLMLGQIQRGLSANGLLHLMPVSEELGTSLVAIKIPRQYGRAGRTIRDISLPPNTFISLVIPRDGDATIPDIDTQIRAGDEVVAVTTAQGEDELRDLLIAGAEE